MPFGRLPATTTPRQNNPRQVVALLGMSLHTIQDFYTHANWPETQAPPAGADYGTVTWFDATSVQREGVKSGKASTSSDTSQTPHGGYASGMNHDSSVRPNGDRAYVFAYAGGRQWVNQGCLWVSEIDPAVWESAKALSLTGKHLSRLNSDDRAMYRISEWVRNGSEDGHWTGNGSGVRKDFLAFAATWVAFTLDSVFVEDIWNRKWHQLLAGGLRGALDLTVDAPPPAAPPPAAAPAVTRLAPHKRAVFLRTVAARDLNGADQRPGLGSDADMFARIRVQNQEFVEAIQLDEGSIRPAWTTIRFIDADVPIVAVHYERWDEDQPCGGDEHLDVHPDRRFRDLDFLYTMDTHQMSGIVGIFGSAAWPFTTRGTASNRARLPFSVTTKTLARTVVRPFRPPVEPVPPILRPVEPPVIRSS